jgi:hypothetical protein
MQKLNFNRAKAHSFMSKAFCSVIIAMAVVSSVSCSKDDDNNYSNSGSLAGTVWHNDSKTNTISYYLQLKFTSETEGNIQAVISLNGVVTPATAPLNFTYKYDGKNGILLWDSSESLNFTVSGNKLTFYENTAVTDGGVPLAGVTFIKQ